MELLLESRIAGAFTGWAGDTLFELINGQVWKQTRYAYRYVYKYRPEVKILTDGSSHYLAVDGMDEIIEVRRLK